MTDKTPATPELPEPELGYIETDKSRQPAFSARQMREALQSQPAAAVSDEEIWGLWDSQERTGLVGGPCPVKFARAILAQRPQAVVAKAQVPMTDEQFTQLLRKLKRSREVFQAGRDSYETACAPMNSDDEAWSAYLAHHGITAPAGGEQQA